MFAAQKEFLGQLTQLHSFRSYKTQYSLIDWDHWKRTGKYQTKPQGKSKKVYPAAKPGTSNHGIGMAIDVHGITSRNYVINYGEQYGWVHNLPKSDPPHFKYDPSKDKFKNMPTN